MNIPSPTLASLLVFAVVLGTYLTMDVLVRLPRARETRLFGDPTLPSLYRRLLPFVAWAATGWGAQWASLFPKGAERLRAQLALAGRHLRPEHVVGMRFILTAGGILAGLALFILTGDTSLGIGASALFATAGWLWPNLELDRAARLRQEGIIRALPFAIDLIGSAMRSGLEFSAAVDEYVKLDLKNPLTMEFATMRGEMLAATKREVALANMADRVQTREFRSFVDAVLHGLSVGASLVDTMKAQGEDLRRARFALAEQKAARAPSLMIFPLALCILPAVFLVVVVPVWMRWKASRGG